MLENSLKVKGLTTHEFTDLIQRLLDNQVIYRHESQVDSRYYDLYIRMDDLVEDFLSILNVKLFHEPSECFIAVFPPGSKVPGMIDEDLSQQGEKKRLNHSLNTNEIGLLLVLRFLYEEEIRQGRIDNKRCVTVNIENINLSFRNLIKKDLPNNINERKDVFRTLRKLRIISYQTGEQGLGRDAWVTIRPIILYFTFEDIANSIEEMVITNADDDQESAADITGQNGTKTIDQSIFDGSE